MEIHNELNPKIWNGYELREDVEKKLLDIVNEFINSLDVSIDVVDVNIVGSNASFNYTKDSDLDVHIIANFDLISCDKTILNALYNKEKSEFNDKYDLKIRGIDVELYVEDVKSTTISNGVYSLLRKEWIRKPIKIEAPEISVEKEVSIWKDNIEKAVEDRNADRLNKLLNTAYIVRKNSISVDGEYGKGNLIFKGLRNLGLIDRLRNTIVDVRSKELSLESLNEDTRSQLLNKSKSSVKGRQRYNRRTKSSISRTVSQYNEIDMNSLFKNNILTVGIGVRGETDNYTVTIKFGGFLDYLHDEVERNNGELDLRSITQALVKSFNSDNVYVRCSCCLKGDTKIKLLSGETTTIEDMYKRFGNGEEFYVYSTDSLGDFKPGKVSNVFISNYVSDMIKITLDNGEVIETTADHRYMLRDGSYARADELVVGQSLMPMYFSYHNGYENYKKNSCESVTKFFSVYKEVANTLLKEEIENAKIRSGEESIAIHHSDFNKLNNTPENLKPMGVLEHYKYHTDHVKESGSYDKWMEAAQRHNMLVADHSTEEYRIQSEICRRAAKNYWDSLSEKEYQSACNEISKRFENEEHRKKFSVNMKNYWSNLSEEEYRRRCEQSKKSNAKGKEKQSKKRKEYWEKLSKEDRSASAKRVVEIKILNVLKKCLDLGLDLTEENYAYARLNFFEKRYPRVTAMFSCVDDAVKYFKLNHKVAKIEYIHYENPIPVYDMTVPEYSNYLVDAGVVLHNCDFYYRFSYQDSKNDVIAGTPQWIPAPITNPDDSLGRGCKHILLVLSNNMWLVKIASVINNYIKYMQRSYKDAYAKVIYPAIYKKKYEEPVQTSVFDSDELITDKETISDINKRASTSGRFQKGNKQGVRFSQKDTQISFDDEEED